MSDESVGDNTTTLDWLIFNHPWLIHETLSGIRWVVWSKERKAFWKKSMYGYTDDIGRAGRFTWDEAQAILAQANVVGHNEFLLPAPTDE